MTHISVLTLVRGRGLHLRRMIEALVRSRVEPLELVVGLLESVRYDVPTAPFPVRMVQLPTDEAKGLRLRLAEARNLTAKAAHGAELMFLDVDCMVSADVIGAVGEILAQRDAIISPEVLYLRHPVAADWVQADLADDGVPHPVRIFPQSGVRPERHAGLLWSVAFGMRTDTFHRIGGFDPGYIGYGAEDTDFAFAARATGTQLLFLGGAKVFHQCHDVYHPPLQHFDDIVLNAQRFREKWGVWPMEDWLASFAERGMIAWQPAAHAISVLRLPDAADIAAARQPPGTPF